MRDVTPFIGPGAMRVGGYAASRVCCCFYSVLASDLAISVLCLKLILRAGTAVHQSSIVKVHDALGPGRYVVFVGDQQDRHPLFAVELIK